jgi:hypothetical protein
MQPTTQLGGLALPAISGQVVQGRLGKKDCGQRGEAAVPELLRK